MSNTSFPESVHGRDERLNAYHKKIGGPETGWVFVAPRGNLPVRMDNILRREILPNLKGVKWHGWHAFRRGFRRTSVPSALPTIWIQRMLRHCEVQPTQRFYAKTLDASLRDAMQAFNKTAVKAAKNQGTIEGNSQN